MIHHPAAFPRRRAGEIDEMICTILAEEARPLSACVPRPASADLCLVCLECHGVQSVENPALRVIHTDAIMQCNAHLIGQDDSHIFVNKSFVFKECDDGQVRIILHQSSLPYQP